MNNDFHESKTIFELFQDLEIRDLNSNIAVTNGNGSQLRNVESAVAA